MKKKIIFALGFVALVGAGLFYVFQKETDEDKLRKKMKEEDDDFDYWDLDIAEDFEEQDASENQKTEPVQTAEAGKSDTDKSL